MNSNELLNRILYGVEYCGKIYNYNNNRCTRIGKKYDCESCKITKEEEKTICMAWKRVIELSKLYHICKILELINRKFPEPEREQLPKWAKYQKKAEIIPTSQLNLFKKGE